MPQLPQHAGHRSNRALSSSLGAKDVTDLTLQALNEMKHRSDVEPVSRVYGVHVKPFGPDQEKRNSVSVVLRLNLPHRYPLVRPSFKIIKLKGTFIGEADSIMIGTHVNAVLNQRYQNEPLASNVAEPCILALIEAARSWLQPYVKFLEDVPFVSPLISECGRGGGETGEGAAAADRACRAGIGCTRHRSSTAGSLSEVQCRTAA